ncbi:MAG: metallophosphoesterase [Oscillospiraceae bacterium]|nr:metallophosphoesterase [Oscillospiraceae bacterium]
MHTTKTEKVRRSPLITTVIALFTLVCASAPIINYTFRIGYVFIDNEVFPGFAQLLFYLMIINALYSIYFLYRCAAGKPKKTALNVLFVLSCLFGALFALVNYVSSTIAKTGVMLQTLQDMLPYLAALLGVPLILLVLPKLKARKMISAVLCIVFMLAMLLPVFVSFPLRFSFASEPVVLDVGSDYYSVVFSTNADSHGFVSYKAPDGSEKTAYSNDEGVRRIGRIHAVLIPREELENNSYTIHATRVPHVTAYQNRQALGKTIDGKTYHFKGERNIAEPRVISVSDWHWRMKELENAVSSFEQPDLVFLMGDYADFYANDEEVIAYVLKGAAAVTKSEIPAIFVRGNHEVRGNFDMSDLWRKLGLPGYYYQVERGEYMFTVLDCAESASYDWEHDGFYDMLPYLSTQLAWLESLPENGKYNITLIHDSNFNTEEFGLRGRFEEALNENNTKFVVSGHSHALRVYQNEGKSYSVIEDGGYGRINGPKNILDIFHIGTYTYKCAEIRFEGENVIVTGKDHQGSIVDDFSFKK